MQTKLFLMFKGKKKVATSFLFSLIPFSQRVSIPLHQKVTELLVKHGGPMPLLPATQKA
jgi:hypothetical protein